MHDNQGNHDNWGNRNSLWDQENYKNECMDKNQHTYFNEHIISILCFISRNSPKNGRVSRGTLVIFVWATNGQKYLNGHISQKRRYRALTHIYSYKTLK